MGKRLVKMGAKEKGSPVTCAWCNRGRNSFLVFEIGKAGLSFARSVQQILGRTVLRWRGTLTLLFQESGENSLGNIQAQSEVGCVEDAGDLKDDFLKAALGSDREVFRRRVEGIPRNEVAAGFENEVVERCGRVL